MNASVASLLAVAAISSIPAAALAQSSLAPRSSARDVDRLTLLTGPTLLSWPRNVPTMMPSAMKLGTSLDRLRVTVGADSAERGMKFDAAQPFLPATPRPSAESLRFDSKLHPSPAPSIRFLPAPRLRRGYE